MAQFAVAFKKLPRGESEIAKDVIKKRCGWSDNLFSMKKKGARALSEFNKKGVNEQHVIESTFKVLGYDAYTGEKIAT